MARDAQGGQTRSRLIDATLAAMEETGFAGLSARSVGARAGVNQALVFYHFETLSGLVVAAYEASVDSAVARYQGALAGASSIADVIDVVEELSADDEARRDGVLMTQLMAQAQFDPALAAVASRALDAWRGAAGDVLDRVVPRTLAAGVLGRDEAVDALVAGMLGGVLVRSVSAGSDAGGVGDPLAALRSLGRLAAVAERLPAPVLRRLAN